MMRVPISHQRLLGSGLFWLLLVGVGLSTGCLYPSRDEVIANLPCTADGECASGYFCLREICVVDGTRLDGGAPDGGVDVDSGVDAGPDAGPDAGFDAGPDGGFDAGPHIPVPTARTLQGVAAGAGRLQSSSYRADIRVGGSVVSGGGQSSSFRMRVGGL